MEIATARARARARSVVTAAGARPSHQLEIARLERAPWGSPADMDASRLARLASTVRRARTSSPFYREVLRGVAVPRSFQELAALPVTTKVDLRDRGLERAPARPVRLRRVWRTSGSTGVPYQFEVGFWYPDRHRAHRAYVYLAAGVERGARIIEMVGGHQWADTPSWSYPTFRRTEVGYKRDDLAEVVREIGPELLYGNRSELLAVAEDLERVGGAIRIPYVCSSSETLHRRDEARLKDVFGAEVLEVYGSTEASNLAYRLHGERDWTILEPRAIVEVVDDDGRPVPAGGSGQVVVTTLSEPTAPLIRYATGDRARVAHGSGDGASGMRLSALEGRIEDNLVDVQGRRAYWTPTVFDSPDIVAHVARWQVHQGPDRALRVAVELLPGGRLDAIEALVTDHFRSRLGDLPIRFEATGPAPPPRGTKYRAITSDAVPVG